MFYVAKANFLPRLQSEKKLRWDYDFIELGENTYGYTPIDTEKAIPTDYEDWTVGSSSSISSGAESPVDESQSWEGDTLASNSDTEVLR